MSKNYLFNKKKIFGIIYFIEIFFLIKVFKLIEWTFKIRHFINFSKLSYFRDKWI